MPDILHDKCCAVETAGPGHADDLRIEKSALLARCAAAEEGRRHTEERLKLSNDLLNAITHAQTQFISNIDTRILFDDLLSSLLALTNSEYGFIGEIFHEEDGTPYLKSHAITNIAWDDATRSLYERHAATGLEFRNLKSLFGAVIAGGRAVISNSPAADPRRCGIPPGHPPLNAFLGLPFYKGDTFIGMVGIANRPGGYDDWIANYLSPFLSTCANIIAAHRIDRERNASERRLRDSERKYRSLFEDSKDAVFITEPDGTIVDVNPAGLELFGYPALEEILKVNSADLYVNPFERKRFSEAVERQGFIRDFEASVKRSDGTPLSVSITSTAVRDSNGGVTEYHSIVRDMTEHKRLLAQLLQAQKMDAVGQLTGGIAHDFNNILTGLIGYTNLLSRKKAEDPVVQKYSQHILGLAERASKLTHGLLTFSRKQIPDLEPVELNQLVRNMERLLSRLIREDIDLKAAYAPDDLVVMADGSQVEQVLMNLVVNARDAMQGGGRLTISTGHARFDDDLVVKTEAFGEPGEFACISVSDTGTGMDEETKAKIFEPFFTTKEVGKGTGLGLAIVYGIVKQHNGRIHVYSRPGLGSTFKIYLPLINSAKPSVSGEKAEPLPRGDETILLIEDDSEVSLVTRTVLEEFGYRVLEASDGEEGVKLFLSNPGSIDLVILDVIMPRMNGKAAYDAIKKAAPGIKAIFTSGYTEDIINSQMIAQERLEFISKPLNITTLLKKVREVLDRKVPLPNG